jgi:hypothetical protein
MWQRVYIDVLAEHREDERFCRAALRGWMIVGLRLTAFQPSNRAPQ